MTFFYDPISLLRPGKNHLSPFRISESRPTSGSFTDPVPNVRQKGVVITSRKEKERETEKKKKGTLATYFIVLHPDLGNYPIDKETSLGFFG